MCTSTTSSSWANASAAVEATRHDRIEAVIEHTELRTFFVVEDDHDFQRGAGRARDDRRGFPWV